MSDTIFIFGAGASFDAKIPLLSNFVQTMWEIAIRKTIHGSPLGKDDVEIFDNAIKVRNELDTYHGRANFDDRNIEDILSILTFNLYEGKKIDRDRMDWIIKAIVRTIELSCEVKHNGVFNIIQQQGSDLYRSFWLALINILKTKYIPTIITFNYDLVLERSLFQVLNNTIFNQHTRPINLEGIRILYHYKFLPYVDYGIKYTNYQVDYIKSKQGSILHELPTNSDNNYCNIELLKLHGSVNFPSKKHDAENINIAIHSINPYIMPPIFNKMQNNQGSDIWKIALSRLRNAKNICIVGYSLPSTDIYIKYFIKSSLGPNIDLNHIYVFDPIIENNNDLSNQMKERYKECFSPQFHDRIIYNPYREMLINNVGTFAHFVSILTNKPDLLLF